MSPLAQQIAIATLCGWTEISKSLTKYGVPSGIAPDDPGVREPLPDYLNDLNAMAQAEELILKSSKPWSSRSDDHEHRRYLAELAKVCKLKTREELVLSCSNEDRKHLNFRPGPYPEPIKLPPSATVLGHFIPAYGYELCLVRAKAHERAEALLRCLKKWKS